MQPRLLFELRTYMRAYVTNRRVGFSARTQLIKGARRFPFHFSVNERKSGKHSYPRFARSHSLKLLILSAVSLPLFFLSASLMLDISRLSVFTLKRWMVLVTSAVGLHRSAIMCFPVAIESAIE